jgi:alpha-N-arabinofuranosidase
MQRVVTTLLTVFLLTTFIAPTCAAQTPLASPQPKVTAIHINAAKTARYRIPRTIFGSFLEPIANSTYGGLVAQVLENPSLEEGLWDAGHLKKMIAADPQLLRASELSLPMPWEPLVYAQENRYEPRWNDAANSYRSLLVMGLPDQEVGIRQKVYLPVHRTWKYCGSIYAKYLSGPRALDVSLRERNHREKVFIHAAIQLSGADWASYQFSLELPEHTFAPLEPVDFVVTVNGEGRVLLDQVSLLPADNVDGMDPEVISMVKAMKSPVIRFGGNFTSAYHWRDGVGPLDKRISMKNVAWGIPEYNTFGTEEFLQFCKLVGARPQIALNLGSGTPEESAAWVEYVNQNWGDHSGGLLWELGNELWGKFQIGYPTLQRVAERTKAFSSEIHRVDPRAILIGTGADEDFYHDWNAAQLSNADSFRYLSTHFVVTTDEVLRKDPSPDFLAEATFALPVGLERKLREMYGQIQSVPGARDNIKIAFTEWLFWTKSDKSPRYDNLGGAIASAGFLNMLMRAADIVPISDMTGTLYFGGIWKARGRAFGVPSYWAFRMYSNADATRPVEVATDSPKYNVEEGSKRIPNIPDVPYLDVVAALNDLGDTLTLFCVNRHLTSDISARLTIDGFKPAAGASAQSLYADSIFEKNDEVSPEAIAPQVSNPRWEGTHLDFTFRRASVTVLTLHSAK